MSRRYGFDHGLPVLATCAALIYVPSLLVDLAFGARGIPAWALRQLNTMPDTLADFGGDDE